MASTVAAHGDCTRYDAYFPAYLLKCLQDWFDRYGEELYSELKHIRNALDQLLASARFAERVQRHARHLDVLVSTHRLIEHRLAERKTSAPNQLTLFCPLPLPSNTSITPAPLRPPQLPRKRRQRSPRS